MCVIACAACVEEKKEIQEKEELGNEVEDRWKKDKVKKSVEFKRNILQVIMLKIYRRSIDSIENILLNCVC